MTKQELKARQAKTRAQNYLAITEQVTELLEASLKINVESMRGNMYSEFWPFADRAAKIEAAITFQIREWVRQESEYELKTWTVDYFDCENVQGEQEQQGQGTQRQTDNVRSRLHSCANGVAYHAE
jgi:hypothetical protein